MISNAWLILGVLIAAIGLSVASYRFARSNEHHRCEAEKAAVMAQALAELPRVAAAGRQVETVALHRGVMQRAHTDQLIREARRHEENTPAVAVCHFDDSRMQLWRAANAGADSAPDPAFDPDPSAAGATAATVIEYPGRVTGEPHPHGGDVPRTAATVSGAGEVAGGGE